MKISHPAAIRLTTLLASWAIPLWFGTQEILLAMDDPDSEPSRAQRKGVYVFWHENLLPGTYVYSRYFSSLVSQHRDGELIAQTLQFLGGRVVRGSTNKRGAAALRSMMREARHHHIGIATDGPRGPRRVVQDGAVYLASRAGMPLMPIAFGSSHCWRARSWDKMMLPRPGGKMRVVVGKPLMIPRRAKEEELEFYRQEIQRRLDDAQLRAEIWAAGGSINSTIIPISGLHRRRRRWVKNQIGGKG